MIKQNRISREWGLEFCKGLEGMGLPFLICLSVKTPQLLPWRTGPQGVTWEPETELLADLNLPVLHSRISQLLEQWKVKLPFRSHFV